MAKNKTAQTAKSVDAFINAIDVESKRDDAYLLIDLFKRLTGFEPALWGPSIIGFGTVHYKYESGHEGDMPLAAFSPRKAATVIYRSGGQEELLKKLGKHKASKGCVYIKKLEDVDMKVLAKVIETSIKNAKKQDTGK